MNERHHVLATSQSEGETTTHTAYCVTEGCGWSEHADSIPDTLVLVATHDPRCEAITQHDRAPIALSCQRMALHPGPHQHTVRWT